MKLPMTATAPSTQDEQCVTAFTHAEIMTDVDTGRPTFCIAADQHLSDFQAATPAQGLAAAAKLRAKADRIEQLARDYAAAHVIPAFVERFNITLRETSLDGLSDVDPELASAFLGYGALLKTGELLVIVPKGQDPIVRLGALRDVVLDVQKQAEAA